MPKERVVQAEGTADTKALRQEQEKASEEAAERAQGGVCEARGAGHPSFEVAPGVKRTLQ